MKFVNARELDRKSGCTLGRTWGTRPEPMTVVERSNPSEVDDLPWTSLIYVAVAVARYRYSGDCPNSCDSMESRRRSTNRPSANTAARSMPSSTKPSRR
jgi:hypothetical protein